MVFFLWDGGTARQWNHFEMVYMLLAGSVTPLVLSVHFRSYRLTLPSRPARMAHYDFPPTFVAGAIFSGFRYRYHSMVILRVVMPVFKDYITLNHMENMNKDHYDDGYACGYAYASEFFIAWYSGSSTNSVFINRSIWSLLVVVLDYGDL
ncbi:MAG: hypothetical protein R2827_16620 [Bdellovibrionales bacterium]